MLTDSSFGEEFDTIVDEVTDQYVNNELTDEERERVEKYFLNTPERQRKLEFATELLSHADAKRGERAERATVLERKPGLLELFLGFWRQRSFAHVALTAAAVIIVAGLIFYLMSFGDSPEYSAINLPLSNSSRGESTAPARVPYVEAGTRQFSFTIPDDARDANAYRVKLIDGNEVAHDLTLERKDQTITVRVPAALLTRGIYAIQLFKVKADGTDERVRGSYFFNVE